MGGIARYVAGSIVLALLGGLCLAASLYHRALARAQQELATHDYAEAAEALGAAERHLAPVRWLPWVRSGPLADVRTRRAALRYWARDYEPIAAERADADATAPADVERQLIAANAIYRQGQAQARDRRASLDALQSAGSAYLEVLRSAGAGAPGSAQWRVGAVAAYNYEYVVRTRDDIDKGTRAPDLTDKAEDGPAGRQGMPPPQDPKNPDLKLLIPLDPSELDKGIEPGRGEPIERKG